jgi:hypothetical protein
MRNEPLKQLPEVHDLAASTGCPAAVQSMIVCRVGAVSSRKVVDA